MSDCDLVGLVLVEISNIPLNGEMDRNNKYFELSPEAALKTLQYLIVKAREVVDLTTPKNPAAVALGRKGGAAKVPKGLAMATPAQRKANTLKGWATRRAKQQHKPTPSDDELAW